MAIMPTTREYSPPLEAAAETGIEFDLLDLLLVMAQRKLTIILATIIGLFVGMVVVFLIHPTFTAKAVIMPPQQGQSSAALVTQLGQPCVPDRAGQRRLACATLTTFTWQLFRATPWRMR